MVFTLMRMSGRHGCHRQRDAGGGWSVVTLTKNSTDPYARAKGRRVGVAEMRAGAGASRMRRQTSTSAYTRENTASSYSGAKGSSIRHDPARGKPRSNENAPGQSQSSALAAQVHEKQKELDTLRVIRDLSAGLAQQMEDLESQMSTLENGTEVVANVLANWQNVFRAIGLASASLQQDTSHENVYTDTLVRIAGDSS